MASETAAPAATEPAETKFEDVWRPKRHHRHDDMDKSEWPHGKSRGHKRRHGRKGHIPQSTAERSNETFNPPASIAGEPPSAELTNQGRERHHRRNKPHQKGQPGGRADPKQDGRNNSNRSGPDERFNRSTTSASPQRKTSVDPDSPFASLGALRDVLEKKMKEVKSP
jgi:ATP-dependent RNA helicase SUPV3L1/SUV3